MTDNLEAEVTSADDIAGVLSWIEQFAESQGLPQPAVFHLQLVCDEWLTDVISYGFPDGRTPRIHVSISLKGEAVKIEIVDSGVPFDPLAQPAPDLISPLETRKAGGLGIHFIRTMMSDLEYQRADDRNHLKMQLRLSPGSAKGKNP